MTEPVLIGIVGNVYIYREDDNDLVFRVWDRGMVVDEMSFRPHKIKKLLDILTEELGKE